MEGLFDNLEGRSDSQNFEPLTSTLRFSPRNECTRSIQCLLSPGSRLQNTSVCTTLDIQQAQPSSEYGKSNFPTVHCKNMCVVKCVIFTHYTRCQVCN